MGNMLVSREIGTYDSDIFGILGRTESSEWPFISVRNGAFV
jgi:hypothetical protein